MADDEEEAKKREKELAAEVLENQKKHDEALAAQAASYKEAAE